MIEYERDPSQLPGTAASTPSTNDHRRCLWTEAALEARAYGVRRDDSRISDGVREWNREHFWPWTVERALEHLTGRVRWTQLDPHAYALLSEDEVTRIIGGPPRSVLARLRGADPTDDPAAHALLTRLNAVLGRTGL